MTRDAGGIWYADLPDAKPGEEYRYLVRNGAASLSRSDPYVRAVTSSVGGGIIVDPAHDWHSDAFQMPPWNELVIFELQVGTFHRWDQGGPGDDAVVVANFRHEARGVYRIGLPHEGVWKLRLNTGGAMATTSRLFQPRRHGRAWRVRRPAVLGRGRHRALQRPCPLTGR